MEHLFKKYAAYSATDFILDEDFVDFVKNPDKVNLNFWASFMLAYPNQKSTIEVSKYIINHLNVNIEKISQEDLERVWTNLEAQHKIEFGTNNTGVQFKNAGRSSFLIAASIALFLLVGGGLVYYFFSSNPKLSKTEYYADFGNTRSIVLPDSSEVILNANSKLSIKNNWSTEKTREVWLEGEAFFKVTKQKTITQSNAHFTVHTKNINIDVLGTQFNVNNRRNTSKVCLSEGKVKITDDNNSEIIMKPGELVTYNDTDKSFKSENVDAKTYLAWTNNQFVFDNTPLIEIAQMLKDNYNLEVKIKQKELLYKKITGTIPAKNIDTLLRVLEASLNITIKKQNSILTISKR